MLKRVMATTFTILLVTSSVQARLLYESHLVSLHSIPAEQNARNQHPIDINVDQLEALLSRLEVQSGNTEGEPVALFPGANALAVASQLHTALRHLNEDAELLLIGYRKEGGLLGTNRYATSARLYVEDGRLHMIFGQVDQFHSEFRDQDRKLPRPGTRQTVAALSGNLVLGADLIRQQNRSDWLAADLSIPLAPAKQRRYGYNRIGYGDRPQPPAKAAHPVVATERVGDTPLSRVEQLSSEFELLQRLKERGILTPDEYQDKKQELLKRL